MTASAPFTLRPAEPRDVAAIVQMIHDLAAFEQLAHLVRVTPETLRPQLFGAKPAAEALVVELASSEDVGNGNGNGNGNVNGNGNGNGNGSGSDKGDGDGDGDADGDVVAFALFFTNFSTFLAQPGLYLEDLYVKPEQRGKQIGKALLEHLAALAVARGCGRFEWSVLDWNQNAIRFYEGMGAVVMPDWRICRVSGDALAQLGANGR